MTPQHTLRRPDQPVQIGPRHGYRIDGDHVFINAELQVPPYRSGGEWTLELWAAEQPHGEGRSLTGFKVAQLELELPTPIGPYTHQVDACTDARLPLQGHAYAMVLALVQRGADGTSSVHAFANYADPQTFSAPHFEGAVGYRAQGPEIQLQADGVFNPRPSGNLSGTLSLELWAFPESGPATGGLRLAASEIECIPGGTRLEAIERSVAFSEPPVGRFQLALLLSEWTFAHGYVARDRRDFRSIYEHSAPELPALSQEHALVTEAVPAHPIDRLRLVPTARPAGAEASAVTIGSEGPIRSLVSIQTASVEELARVKGLSRKIANEIVKARPFASLADLIRVRGLGPKTIEKLKGLVTL